MASVPVYNGGVRESGLPQARAGANTSVDTFGGGGAQFTEAAQRTLGVVDKIREQAEQTRIQEADNQAALIQKNLMFGSEDGSVKGAKDRLGKDAFGVVEEYGTAYQKSVDDIEKGLASPAQRAAFRQRAVLRERDLRAELERHSAVETDKYATGVFKAGMQIAKDDAVANYYNPAKLNSALVTQQELVDAEANRQGLPEEVRALQKKQIASQTHTDIIERMALNGDDLLAEKHFHENKDQFTSDDLIKNEKFVADNSRLSIAQKFTDTAFRRGMSMTGALAEARKIEDPKLREFTTKKVQEEFSIRKNAQDEDNRRRFEGYADVLESTKGDIDAIRKQPGYAALDLREVQALETRAQQLRAGKNIVTDFTKYTDLMALLASPETQGEAMKISPMAMRPYLADREFNKFVDAQNKIRAGKGSADVSLFKTSKDIANNSLTSAGIDPKKKNNKEKVAEFYKLIDTKMNDYAAENNGAMPSKKEIQRIVDEQLVEGVVPNTGIFGFFKDKKKLYELESGESVVVQYKDIPQSTRDRIKNYLTSKKLPNNEQAVTKMFYEMNKRDAGT